MRETPSNPFRGALAAAWLPLVLAALWVVLAARQPTLNRHLAAPLIAGTWPLVARAHGRTAGVIAAGLGATMVAVLALAMGSLGWLAGPSLLPIGGAVLEAVVFGLGASAVAAAVVAVDGVMRRPTDPDLPPATDDLDLGPG